MSSITDILERAYDLGIRMEEVRNANNDPAWYSLCDIYYTFLEELSPDHRSYADMARQAGVRKDEKCNALMVIIQDFEHCHREESAVNETMSDIGEILNRAFDLGMEFKQAYKTANKADIYSVSRKYQELAENVSPELHMFINKARYGGWHRGGKNKLIPKILREIEKSGILEGGPVNVIDVVVDVNGEKHVIGKCSLVEDTSLESWSGVEIDIKEGSALGNLIYTQLPWLIEAAKLRKQLDDANEALEEARQELADLKAIEGVRDLMIEGFEGRKS